MSELPFKLEKKYQINKVEVTIKGDANDGDYIRRSSILKIDDFVKLYPYLNELLPSGTGDCCNEECDYSSIEDEIVELYDETIRLPYGESGCHSLSYDSMVLYDENGIGWIVK